MKKQLYFAYGSNISSEQMRLRMPTDYGYCGKFLLQGYKLVFNVGYENYVSYANIEPCEGESVEGVLYSLSHRQMMQLDSYEALYTREYFDHPTLPDTIIAVYIGNPDRIITEIPDESYINRIIKGCAERGLTLTLAKLFMFKKDNYKTKKHTNEKSRNSRLESRR